jgi:hypothetical protein
VAISVDQLPTNNNGIVDGTWTIQLRQNLNGGHAGVEFRDGRSVTPLDGNALRRFVSAMGQDVVGAYRSADDTAVGDVSTLKPEHYDQVHEKSLAAQDSNKLLNEQATAQNFGKENEHTDAAHIAAGAKFISPEEAERRREFEKASGREVKEDGNTPSGESSNASGTTRTGSEPIDPAALPDGDPLKPVPVGDTKIGEVSVTVDTGKAKETYKGEVKTPENSPLPSPNPATPSSTPKSYTSELKGSEKSTKK